MPKQKHAPRRYDPNDPEIKHMGQWSWNTRLLWDKVQPACGDQCYTWTGSTGPHANLFGARKNTGSGPKPQMSQAARFIYAETYNVDVTDLEIRHSCGNRYCCRPDHMLAVPNHMNRTKPKYQPKRVKAQTLKTQTVKKEKPAKSSQQPWWQI